MRKQFEKTCETEHTAVELSDETLDEVTGATKKLGRAARRAAAAVKCTWCIRSGRSLPRR